MGANGLYVGKIKSLLKRFAGPGTYGNRSVPDKEVLVFRAVEHAVPLRVLQRVQPYKLQHLQSGCTLPRYRATEERGCGGAGTAEREAKSATFPVSIRLAIPGDDRRG